MNQQRASLAEIGLKALQIMQACVDNGPRLGGKITAGDRDGLIIVVGGRMAPSVASEGAQCRNRSGGNGK